MCLLVFFLAAAASVRSLIIVNPTNGTVLPANQPFLVNLSEYKGEANGTLTCARGTASRLLDMLPDTDYIFVPNSNQHGACTLLVGEERGDNVVALITLASLTIPNIAALLAPGRVFSTPYTYLACDECDVCDERDVINLEPLRGP